MCTFAILFDHIPLPKSHIPHTNFINIFFPLSFRLEYKHKLITQISNLTLQEKKCFYRAQIIPFSAKPVKRQPKHPRFRQKGTFICLPSLLELCDIMIWRCRNHLEVSKEQWPMPQRGSAVISM